MIVLLADAMNLGWCEECGKGKSEKDMGEVVGAWPHWTRLKLFRLSFGSKELVLCLDCYRKLSDILVFELDYGAKDVIRVVR